MLPEQPSDGLYNCLEAIQADRVQGAGIQSCPKYSKMGFVSLQGQTGILEVGPTPGR